MRQLWAPAAMVMAMFESASSFLVTPPEIGRDASLRHSVSSVRSTTADALDTTHLSPPVSAPQHRRVPGGELLSLGVSELSEVLEGSGRAKMVWKALAQGVDPFSSEEAAEFVTPRTAQLLEDAVERLPWEVCPLRCKQHLSLCRRIMPFPTLVKRRRGASST